MATASTNRGFLARAKHYFVPDMSSYDPDAEIDHSLLRDCKPHHRKVVELALTDLYGRRAEAILRLPASWERFMVDKLLSDKRDIHLALTFLQIALWLTASVCIQLFLLPRDSYAAYLWAIPHTVVTWVMFAQRFILAMHYAAHRALFCHKKLGVVASLLNAIPTTIMSNFYGMPAGAYYVHHCIMHHQANNLFPYDLSSTMPYDRTRPSHFIAYVCNFLAHTFLYLPYYCVIKKRYDIGATCLALLAGYCGAIKLIYDWDPVFFLATFSPAFIIGPFALMLGNFSQHVFIDPDSPTSNYTLACNHVNAPFNMLTFNDGYHITHHVTSICHWSEMPLHFIKNLDKYEQGGAIIFREIMFDDITFAVWQGEKGLRWLAKRVVQITPEDKHMTEEQLVAMFRRRLQPIKTSGDKPLDSPAFSIFLVNQALWLTLYMLGWPVSLTPCICVAVFYAIYHLGSLSWIS